MCSRSAPGRNKWSPMGENKLCCRWYTRCSNATSDHVKANRSNLELVCWRASMRQRALCSCTLKPMELSSHSAHSECSMCFNLTFHFALALSRLLFMNRFPTLRSLPANTGVPTAYEYAHTHPNAKLQSTTEGEESESRQQKRNEGLLLRRNGF